MGKPPRICKQTLAILAVILSLTLALTAAANAQLRKLNIAYTATSPYQAATIIAKETGLFRKHGLDVTMIFTSGGSLGI